MSMFGPSADRWPSLGSLTPFHGFYGQERDLLRHQEIREQKVGSTVLKRW